MRSALTLLTLFLATSQQEVAGTWRGTSTCTEPRGACHDEVVVYRVVPKEKDVVSVTMSKIVNGEELALADAFDFRVSGSSMSMIYDNGRYRMRWSFSATGSAMTGTLTLLPEERIARHISLRRE